MSVLVNIHLFTCKHVFMWKYIVVFRYTSLVDNKVFVTGAESEVRLAECLLSICETQVLIRSIAKIPARWCTLKKKKKNPTPEARGSDVQSHPPLRIELEALQGYMKLFLKQNNAKDTAYYNLFSTYKYK